MIEHDGVQLSLMGAKFQTPALDTGGSPQNHLDRWNHCGQGCCASQLAGRIEQPGKV